MTTRTETQKLEELATALHARGIVITIGMLAQRTSFERNAAQAWALLRSPSSSCPAWLVFCIEKGKAVRLRGTCRECGCTDDEACKGGCSWADLNHTLCSNCVPGGRR